MILISSPFDSFFVTVVLISYLWLHLYPTVCNFFIWFHYKPANFPVWLIRHAYKASIRWMNNERGCVMVV